MLLVSVSLTSLTRTSHLFSTALQSHHSLSLLPALQAASLSHMRDGIRGYDLCVRGFNQGSQSYSSSILWTRSCHLIQPWDSLVRKVPVA